AGAALTTHLKQSLILLRRLGCLRHLVSYRVALQRSLSMTEIALAGDHCGDNGRAALLQATTPELVQHRTISRISE
ncbi:hypothetical protein, partial [Kineococcus sp. G2]|uniref:hypothetical protein n=1 Tax=Kineococcus sp. G2 TaxID=3127484 RepID=UPI00301C6E39